MTLAVLATGGAACAPTGAGDSKLPPEVQDPATLRTPAGALELYRSSLLVLPGAIDEVMIRGAILTDELKALPTPPGLGGRYTALDSRQNSTGAGDLAYTRLHRLRAQVREARSFLSAYTTDTMMAREQRGHLYAVEGYADVLLADLYCSGIPLSTVDFEGDYTLAAGSSTREVYQRAVGLFDSALALTQDSLMYQHLAAIGRGRALLALGVYDSAALAVAAVPTDYRYQVTTLASAMYDFVNGHPDAGGNYTTAPGFPTVGEHEGENGLDYRTSSDLRVGGTALGPDVLGHTMYFPTKYFPVGPNVTLTLADGIEARLIEVEGTLQAGDGSWLTLLNALRTNGTFTTQPNAEDTTQTDTLWQPGTGGVSGLRRLEDPGNADARVDLLFRERALWLYLTAHRQGDLRRLIRNYGRDQATIYPAGLYSEAGDTYGNTVVVPVPPTEQQLNPKYEGCSNLNS